MSSILPLDAGAGMGSGNRAADQSSGVHVIENLCERGMLKEALDVLRSMSQQGIGASRDIYLFVLQACITLDEAREVYTIINQSRFASDSYLGNSVVHMFVKCGSVSDALLVFNKLHRRTSFSWTAIISWYSNSGQGVEALKNYHRMQAEGVMPTKYTFISILKTCGSLGDLEKGKQIHNELIQSGRPLDVFLGTALIDMYAKCASMVDAQCVFNTLALHDVVMWTAMIAGYAQQGQGAKALELYTQMKAEGVEPNDRTFVSLLKACGSGAVLEEARLINGQLFKLDSLYMCRLIHAEIVKRGFELDTFVCNTLIDLYAKCGSMIDARFVFDTSLQRSVVSWTALISGYAQQEQGEKALQLYRQMQRDSVRADEATFLCVLKACGHVGSLRMCWEIHQDIIARDIVYSVTVANSLIHTYGKCGSMVQAQHIFDTMPHRNKVSWSALIAGYAREGKYWQSLHYVAEMEQAGIKPDAVTFLSLFTACSHAGLVDEGLELFRSMTIEQGITATIQHYASLVDLLSRAGLLKLAEEVLLNMPIQPDLAMWLSLLGACRQYQDTEIGRRAFEHAVRIEPAQSSAYMLMKTIYADAQMWEDAMFIEEAREQANAWKKPGQTWLDDSQTVHIFMVGDEPDLQISLIYSKLKESRQSGSAQDLVVHGMSNSR